MNNSRILNLYYISTRYPNAFASGATSPKDKFSKTQAKEAVKFSREILDYVKKEIQSD